MKTSSSHIITILLLMLSGCSSGEGNSPDEPTVDIPESNNVYFEFNKWTYSQMNRQYLWREDMPDSLDCDYELTPREFFNSLLSKKDRFSYFTVNSSRSRGDQRDVYGFAYQIYRDNTGNEAMQVLYISADEARQAGIKRGDFLQPICTSINNATFRVIAVVNNHFVETEQIITYSLPGLAENKNTVLLDSIYQIETHKIGYMCYIEYDDPKDLMPSIERFSEAGITDLILDLRYNPGGYVSTCKFLCNCIVPANGYEQIFQQCSYNDILSEYYREKTGESRTYNYFEVPNDLLGGLMGYHIINLCLERLYVLTSNRTASASEATVVCLRPFMPVILIGETTVGKGVGSWTISNPQYYYALQPITMRYYNANGETTPDEGLEVDYPVPGGYSTVRSEIGNITEPLLHKALSVITGISIPRIQTVGNNNSGGLEAVGEPSFVTEFQSRFQGDGVETMRE